MEEERRCLVEQMLKVLDRLGPAFGIRQAYLFGSVARPQGFRKHSDVDLAIEQIDQHLFFPALARFSSEIGRPVDLVEMAHCRFAAKIRREGISWTKPV